MERLTITQFKKGRKTMFILNKETEKKLNVGDRIQFNDSPLYEVIKLTNSIIDPSKIHCDVKNLETNENHSLWLHQLYECKVYEDTRNSFLDTIEISFEISDSGLTLDEVIERVKSKYPKFKFSRTESRYDSCVMAIFEKN